MRNTIIIAALLTLLMLCGLNCQQAESITAPTDNTDMRAAICDQYVTEAMDTFMVDFDLDGMPVRTGAALSDYTDMECYIDIMGWQLPGPLPAYWALHLMVILNGPDWQDWVHPNYPWMDGCYLWSHCTSLFHYAIGCDYMTRMVVTYEEVHGIDIPNNDEVDWPDC